MYVLILIPGAAKQLSCLLYLQELLLIYVTKVGSFSEVTDCLVLWISVVEMNTEQAEC